MSETPTVAPSAPEKPQSGSGLADLFFVFLLFVLHIVASKKGCFQQFLVCLKEKTKELNGRSRRKEYVGFYFANILLALDAVFIDSKLGTTFSDGNAGVFVLLYFIVTVVPYVAVTIRRLHDTGNGAVLAIVLLIPILNLCLVLYLLFVDSQVGPNAYGPNPKDVVYDTPTETAEYVPVYDAQAVGNVVSGTEEQAALSASLTGHSKSPEPFGTQDSDVRTNLV